jgi:hypothetical protein
VNPSLANRIAESHTFVVAASTNKLVGSDVENRSIARRSAVDIEREVIARERHKLLIRIATTR